MAFDTDEEEINHQTNKFLSKVFGKNIISPAREEIPFSQEYRKMLNHQILTYKNIIATWGFLKDTTFEVPFKTDKKQFTDWFTLNEKNESKLNYFYPKKS